MQRHVELIGAAWGLGGADPGCAEAPRVLMPLLRERLAAQGVINFTGPILEPPPGERRKTFAVSKLCGELAAAVAAARRRDRLPCVIGGDHSCAGGTWTGVARTLQGSLGLVWIDAHMDSHTPATSHTGRLHGMPLAWLLGQDDDPLYGLAAGVLEPRHVCLVGVRSYEPEEDERLRRLGVRVVFMDEVRARGIDAVLEEALDIAAAGTEGFGVSIDLDVITPEEAPNVGTPVKGGVSSAALAGALEKIPARPGLTAVELVEYSPRLDRDGRTARVALDLLGAALSGPRQDAEVITASVQRDDP
ncbi:MAG TPA: arginase [Burkholderiales bacterium]|nr:arginase [Burkholderiales bacterium]